MLIRATCILVGSRSLSLITQMKEKVTLMVECNEDSSHLMTLLQSVWLVMPCASRQNQAAMIRVSLRLVSPSYNSVPYWHAYANMT